jgi:hypothetical protein
METPFSARDAIMIAAQYGFSYLHGTDWERKLIYDCIIRARSAHMRERIQDKRMSAVRYFDEYMAQTAADIRELKSVI